MKFLPVHSCFGCEAETLPPLMITSVVISSLITTLRHSGYIVSASSPYLWSNQLRNTSTLTSYIPAGRAIEVDLSVPRRELDYDSYAEADEGFIEIPSIHIFVW
jgi:hypothetical protein